MIIDDIWMTRCSVLRWRDYLSACILLCTSFKVNRSRSCFYSNSFNNHFFLAMGLKSSTLLATVMVITDVSGNILSKKFVSTLCCSLGWDIFGVFVCLVHFLPQYLLKFIMVSLGTMIVPILGLYNSSVSCWAYDIFLCVCVCNV